MGSVRIATLAACFLVAVLDGFDFVAIGVVAPSIMRDIAMNTTELGFVLAATQFGAAIGAVTFGKAADRYGRKTIILLSLYLVVGFTLLTAFAESFTGMVIVRFLAGLALTGALPPILALASELAPERYRATLLSMVVAGFPFGAGLGSLVSGSVGGEFGWRAVFMIGAATAFAVAFVVHLAVVESPRFLARTDFRGERIAAVMRKLVPGVDTQGLWRPMPHRASGKQESEGSGSLSDLFRGDLARQTTLLWLMLLCSGILSNVCLVWLPTLFDGQGLGMAHAATVVAAINIGATLGMASAGRLLEIIGVSSTVALAYGVAALGTLAIGFAPEGTLAIGLAALTGFFLGVTTSAGYSLAALIYPHAIRGTGVGASAAALRVGTLLAPLIMPIIIMMALPFVGTFAIVALIPAIAGVLAIGLDRDVATPPANLKPSPQ